MHNIDEEKIQKILNNIQPNSNEGYISQTLVSCNDSIPTTYLTTM